MLFGNASCSGKSLALKSLLCSHIDEGMGVHIHMYCCIVGPVNMSKKIRVSLPAYIAVEVIVDRIAISFN